MRNAKLGIFSVLSIASLIALSLVCMPRANALAVTGFNPGNIISDRVFTNTTSMSVSQIQTFLNTMVPTCDTQGTQTSEYGGGTRAQWAASRGYSTPFTCLKDYSENGLSSAQIIYNAAQNNQINPQVLIVLLQKEQGLVTDTWPVSKQYQSATGYGCPDSTPGVCSSQYYGFTNQVNNAAHMFRSVINNSSTWYSPYTIGNNSILYNPSSSCGSSNVYIQNMSTVALYDYTPYQPNQASLNAGYGSGDSCSSYGNRNFYLYFRDWFGYNSGPAAFMTQGSSTVYIPVDGYRVQVPYMAALQDYGVSADSIQTVSQAYVDSFPVPPASTGVSSTFSQVVKSPDDGDADGASVYLVSRGKRYKVQTMQQLYNYGFSDSDVTYLPLTYILSISTGGDLSDYATSPYGSVFKVSTAGKQLILDFASYQSLNPSDTVTPLSYYLADKITSGSPISSTPTLIQSATDSTVTLYRNGSYYSVPDYETLSCWGLTSTSSIVPTYKLPQSNYTASYTPAAALSCTINNSGNIQVLNGTIRYSAPSSLGLTAMTVPSDLAGIIQAIPLRSDPLKSYIKTSGDPGVWYISGSSRQVIPSYRAFKLLGLGDNDVDQVPQQVERQFNDNGIKLANGELVKTQDSSAVYVISGSSRVLYDSSDIFLALNNSWSDIETFSSTSLDAQYPVSNGRVSSLVVDKTQNKVYMFTKDSCYILSNDLLTAMGKDITTLKNSQNYDKSIFLSANFQCNASTPRFFKLSGQSLVYYIDAGTKHPLLTYAALVNKSGSSNPLVLTVDSTLLSSIATGSSYTQ